MATDVPWSPIVAIAWCGVMACSNPASRQPAVDSAMLDATVGDADGAISVDLVDAAVDAPIVDADPCVVPSVATWTGTANRDNDSGYPDHIHATVKWQRAGTASCVDHYVPTGSVHYGYAIPGALCNQSIAPDTQAIATTDGRLTIDRSTQPPTYTGQAATTWMITFTCTYPSDPPDSFTFTGGGVWFAASGTVGAQIAGEDYVQDDSTRCGPEGIAPCIYTWSLTAATAE